MTEKKCKNCVAWRPQSGIFGFCKKYAPRPTVQPEGMNYVLVWPQTGLDDECEEFKDASMDFDMISNGVAQ